MMILVALLKYSLKFLETKKKTIIINDLKPFDFAANNKKINTFIKEIETNNSIQKIKYVQYILSECIGFFIKDKYCFNYISKLSEIEKRKISFIE